MPVTAEAVGAKLDALQHSWDEKDVILYALGVGAGTDELEYTYEGSNLRTLPTFGVVPAFPALAGIGRVMSFNPMMLLHGEQKLTLHRPIPTSGVYAYPADPGVFPQNSWLDCPVRDDAHFRASAASYATVWGTDGTTHGGSDGAFMVQACAGNWARHRELTGRWELRHDTAESCFARLSSRQAPVQDAGGLAGPDGDVVLRGVPAGSWPVGHPQRASLRDHHAPRLRG